MPIEIVRGGVTMTVALGTPKTEGPIDPIGLRWDPESIAPFPALALKALSLISGKDTSLLELCNLIRSDIAFSTAILRIANSPLIGFPKDISSVLQASMLLGFQRLKSIVITVGLKKYLNGSFTPLIQSCWRHSVACAIIAERNATWNFMDRDFAYTAGILHDIGQLALATLMPGPYARVVACGADQPQSLLPLERELCGIDHCQAGRSLMTAWNLPEAFFEITACHHDREAHLPGTASLLPPSCELADALGFSVLRYRTPRSYAEILGDFPEPNEIHFPADAKELALQIANEIKVMESV